MGSKTELECREKHKQGDPLPEVKETAEDKVVEEEAQAAAIEIKLNEHITTRIISPRSSKKMKVPNLPRPATQRLTRILLILRLLKLLQLKTLCHTIKKWKTSDAVDQRGDNKCAAPDALSRLSRGNAPGSWGQEEPVEQEPIQRAVARARSPRAAIWSRSPCLMLPATSKPVVSKN